MNLGPEMEVFRRDVLGAGCSLLHFIFNGTCFCRRSDGLRRIFMVTVSSAHRSVAGTEVRDQVSQSGWTAYASQ